MNINSDSIRGHIDIIILSLLYKNDMYGYEISKTIESKTGGYVMKETSLYSSLRRLEKNGIIVSYYSKVTHGASKRRYYSMTEIGKRYLKKKCQEWETMKMMIDLFVKEAYDE